MLRIKHGNPVVKVLIGSEEEVIDDKEEVSKRIAEYFQEVYKKKEDDPCTPPTWYRPSITGVHGVSFSQEEVKGAVK